VIRALHCIDLCLFRCLRNRICRITDAEILSNFFSHQIGELKNGENQSSIIRFHFIEESQSAAMMGLGFSPCVRSVIGFPRRALLLESNLVFILFAIGRLTVS
jgi:hypothetical protein